MKGQVPLIFSSLPKGSRTSNCGTPPTLCWPSPCQALLTPAWVNWYELGWQPLPLCGRYDLETPASFARVSKSASSWSITSPPCNHIVSILQWECNEKTWSKEWTWFCSLLAMSSCQRSALTLGGGDVSVTRQIVLWFLTTSLKVPLPQCDCYLAVA